MTLWIFLDNIIVWAPKYTSFEMYWHEKVALWNRDLPKKSYKSHIDVLCMVRIFMNQMLTKTFWKLTLCTGWYSCCHGEMWLLWQGAGNLAIYMTAPSFSHFSLSNNILTKWGAIGKSFGIYCRLYCLLACLSLPPILEKGIGRVLKKRFVKSKAIAKFKDVFWYS